MRETLSEIHEDLGGDRMGTKFANLHIKTVDQEVVLDALQRLSNKVGSILTTSVSPGESIIDQYVYRSSNKEQFRKTASSVSFYTKQVMNWTLS